MKKKIALILAAALTLTACGSAEAPTTTNSESSPTTQSTQTEGTASNTSAAAESTEASQAPNVSTEPITVPEGMDEAAQRQFMIENSLMTLGDTARMVNVMRKAAAGEEITVGYIGGSITEGLTAGAELCWAKLTHTALSEMFPDATVNYVNAGLSGTPSILGVTRAERDLFGGEKKPDIVFIEFAVNDGGDKMNKDCYESLVKKCLDKENNPAVVLLFTVLKNRYSCQDWMSEIGAHYNLPMLSIGNVLNPMIDAGYMTWEKYSDDESHPNVWGHELVKDFVKNYFEQVKALADASDSDKEIPAVPETALHTTEYADMEFISAMDLTLDSNDGFTERQGVATSFDGYQYRAKTGGSISFKAEFKTLFLVFFCNNAENLADAEVIIDGESVNTIPSSRPGGWGNPEADLAWTGEGGSHTVELKIAPSDKAKLYGFAGIGVVK